MGACGSSSNRRSARWDSRSRLPSRTRRTASGSICRAKAAKCCFSAGGETLDALQHIVNTAFRRELDGRSIVRRSIASATAEGKDAELQQMARFSMEKAKSSGAPQEIGPLNPYARRLVHITVATDPQLTSESIGDAFLKTVIISLRR